MTTLQTLEKHFGYSAFRNQQEKIIDTVLAKKDCLVLMPTGGGKSLCFQLPAVILEGLTIVISPLIALMKDQVDALRLNGIEAAFFNSSQSPEQQAEVLKSIQEGKLKLLYIAPERLSAGEISFLDYLKDANVSLVAIDEAHCISHWGHDFRPDYLTLSQFKKEMPTVPVIALTATADELTRKDIVEKLSLDTPEIFISSFNRPNISYSIEKKTHYFEKLLEFLELHKDESGIIYSLSRQSTETLSNKLTKEGFPALPYHAGMESELRTEHQEKFKRDDVKIIVATIAFGMGIDKSNVRYVIHVNMPKNIESYYQETGRAGRDGLPSEAMLFYSPGDLIMLRDFVKVEGNPEQSKIMLGKLKQISEYCEARTCRRKLLLNYFGEGFEGNCGNCDVCLGKVFEEEEKKVEKKLGEAFDGTVLAQKALTAVFHLKGKFGITYIADYLRGSDAKKIWRDHKRLRSFGKGKDQSKEEWRSYLRELVQQGYLEQTDGEYTLLNLTATSKQVMFQNKKVLLHEVPTAAEERTDMRRRALLKTSEVMYDKKHFEELQKVRSKIAKEMNVPPFVVFSDDTLVELAVKLPKEKPELKDITGFSEVKIEKYGDEFLKAMKNFSHVVKTETKKAETEKPVKAKKKIAKEEMEEPQERKPSDLKSGTLKLFNKGLSIEEMAAERHLPIGAIEDHLAHYVSTGDINVLKIISKPRLIEVIRATTKHGDSKLTKLRKELGDDYTFIEIRAAINYWKRVNAAKESG